MPRPAVLFLHAFPLDSRMWDGIAPAVADAGYEVVAPDLPGGDLQLGFPAWAERVLALVDGPFVPVGSSMGGYLTFELWRQEPERIPAMALVGTRATPDSPEQRLARDDSIRLLGEAGREPFWEELAPKIFAEGVDSAVVARARELALAQPITALVTAQETIRDRVDSRPTLAAIDVPVLVLVGRRRGPADPARRRGGDGCRAAGCALDAHPRRRPPRSAGEARSGRPGAAGLPRGGVAP